ncbi:hypothetical protein JAN5088_02376 [Jannaschia rubra]|uniref:Uncharacterized protein n=1 Tax=Jannaschia rubra TaxID=282197 RepID=A0A0M6XUI5_9RHOB|nr:hypothetical protein JAN5088_02376 [Jannaschia rubra]
MLSLFHAGVPPGLKAVARLLLTKKGDDDA